VESQVAARAATGIGLTGGTAEALRTANREAAAAAVDRVATHVVGAGCLGMAECGREREQEGAPP